MGSAAFSQKFFGSAAALPSEITRQSLPFLAWQEPRPPKIFTSSLTGFWWVEFIYVSGAGKVLSVKIRRRRGARQS